MNAPNFSSILDHEVQTIDKPKPLPVGSYIGLADGMPKFDKSTKQKTDYVEFNVKPLSAKEDVNQTALAEALNGKSLTDKKLRLTFYLTEDAVYRLDTFMFEHLDGIEIGMSRKQAISMVPGRQFGFTIRHRASEDGTQIYAEIGSTFKV